MLRLNLILTAIAIILLTHCKKDRFLNDPSARLAFSTDTLTFDTVFTTLGSTTKFFKVYNRNKRPIKISSILLEGGNNSNFRINVDGIPTVKATDIEIAGRDSLYIFVEVTVDPNNQNTPFIISEFILFETNGNMQKVILTAWGQNAIYFNGDIICDTIWTNIKPYVIFNSILVDSSCTLTIQEGVRIHCHGNSGILVKGTLVVNGTKDDPVTFQGTRLEQFYDDKPGQWPGIFILRGSTGSVIDHAVIKNATWGISVGSHDNPDLSSFTLANIPDVTIKHTIVKNSLAVGIFGFFSVIQAENCLVFNSGQHNAQLVFGGFYNFIHVTLANFGSFWLKHNSPILHLSNFVEVDKKPFNRDLDATFTNCIIYGNVEEEIALDDDKIAAFDYLFENCLLKTNLNTTNSVNYMSIIKSDTLIENAPDFVKINDDDYHLQSTSPCINKGKPTSVLDDLEENIRDAVKPDMGAFEFN